jgi:hypothetical protein
MVSLEWVIQLSGVSSLCIQSLLVVAAFLVHSLLEVDRLLRRRLTEVRTLSSRQSGEWCSSPVHLWPRGSGHIVEKKREWGGSAIGSIHRGTWHSGTGLWRARSKGDVAGCAVLIHTHAIAGMVGAVSGRTAADEQERVFFEVPTNCCTRDLGDRLWSRLHTSLLSMDECWSFRPDKLPEVLRVVHVCILIWDTVPIGTSRQDSIGRTTVHVGVLIISTAALRTRLRSIAGVHCGVFATEIRATCFTVLTLSVPPARSVARLFT